MTAPIARRARHVAVIGGTDVTAQVEADAEAVGRLLARAGVVVVTGGREGVASAACRGASEAGGLTVGILPGRDRSDANPWVGVAIPTGLGETRNALVVMDADAVIAFPGAYGTLIELAFALLADAKVVGVGTWALGENTSILSVDTPDEAVRLALG
ncbi:MAG TPA: hypothetical protein VGZ52_07015 [Acidimicrobiales bacterium]|jgi:hypothetical protein|nr:hypothetical protein [Acidimicrobiales bacterium]